MAGTIKGITVEIGGNTAPLDNALKGVNKTSRDLQSELKQVEKLLKLDPTNTELLAQKQKLLADSVDNTKNKLETLKKAEEQVQQQVREGKVSEEQYRAFQREIVKTETDLNRLKTQSSGTSDEVKVLGTNINNTSKNTDDLGDKTGIATKAIAGLGVAAGTAAVGLGVTAFKGANDFKGAINDVVAKTGLADDEMTKFSETLKDIYASNFGESYEDIAQAMATINQQTGLTGDTLKKTTTNALILRDTFSFDVNESMRSAQMLIKQFGITGDEAFNLIAQGAQQGLDKNGDLLDTINEYSVHFKQLGFDSEEMFSALVNGAASGTFSVDKLGDSVKEFGIRSKDGSDTTKNAFKALGLDADELTNKFAIGGTQANEAFKKVTTALFNIKDPVAQNTAGVALFGTMFEDLGAEGIKALSQIGDNANKSIDTLGKISKVKYDTPMQALKGLGRTIETNVITPIGEKLMPKITEVVEKLQSPAAKEAIESVATKVSDLINLILDNSAAIITAIAGIAAGFVAWNVASMISGVVTAIKAFQAANQGATIAQAALNLVMNANPAILIVTLIVGLVTAIITLWNTNEDFRNAVLGIWEGIKSAISTAIDAIVTVFWTIVDFFKDLPGNIWDSLVAVVTKFTEWNTNLTQWIAKNILDLVNKIVNFFKELPGKIWNTLVAIVTKFSEWNTNLTQWIAKNILALITKFVNFFKELPGKIYNAIKGINDKLGSIIQDMIKWVTTEIPKFVSKFVEFMGDLPKKMLDIGKNIVTGIWSGISGSVGWLKDKITGFAGSVVGGMKDALGIHSPSRVLADQVGKYMAQGIGVGFEDEMNSVSNSMVKAIPTQRKDYTDTQKSSISTVPSSNASEFKISIENFVNNRSQDVQAFAQELEFYRKQAAIGTGGQ